MDVGEWLRSLGLEQYEAAFRENGVNADILRHLTADDLKELGVAAVGHRRQLLVAVAKLQGDDASLQVATPPGDHPASIPTEAAVSHTAERRPLSVMFCDLVGSTALSAQLDPEDLREVIRSYQARVAATIQQFNGFIARYVGDGVLIYFGWPQAHETDAERAVRAGLAVATTVSEAPMAGHMLHVRIGIATGWWWLASRLAQGIRASRQRSARRRTAPPGCRASPGRAKW